MPGDMEPVARSIRLAEAGSKDFSVPVTANAAIKLSPSGSGGGVTVAAVMGMGTTLRRPAARPMVVPGPP